MDGISAEAMAYAKLQAVERELREFITRVMEERFGAQWEKLRVPEKIRRRWRERQGYRKKLTYPWAQPIGTICELADFSDCKQVIVRKDNWCEVFLPIFEEADRIAKKLDELYALRNEIMHMRPLAREALDTLCEEVLVTVRRVG